MKTLTLTSILALTVLSAFAGATQTNKKMSMQDMKHEKMMMMSSTTGMFSGPEVHEGTATLYKKGNEFHLKVSDDFKIPTSPAPHWQVIDAKGNTYLLARFTIAGDKTHRDITLPKYITSVKTVQVYCSFAEVVLGEASFKKAVSLR